MKSKASQNHPGRFAIYFLLMFAGLAWAVLGVGYQEPILIGIGAVFILATVFAFRSMVPLSVSAWALVGMLLGGLVGASFGLYVGYVAEAMVGIIGAAVLGATAGAVLLGGGLAGALGAPVFPGVKVVILPRVVAQGLFFLGAMIGGILGVIGLREAVTTVFGPIGGGAVALGSLGLMVGLFLGSRRIEDTDIQEEAEEYTHAETSGHVDRPQAVFKVGEPNVHTYKEPEEPKEYVEKPKIKIWPRAESIIFRWKHGSIGVGYTWTTGDRIYADTIKSWDGTNIELTSDEKEFVFKEVLKFLRRKRKRTIVVINVDDDDKALWELLCSTHAGLIKEVEHTSIEASYQSQKQVYLTILNAGRKLVINDVEINDEEQLEEVLRSIWSRRNSI